ncbi:MAG: dephospho-CoA kinase [Spirochaetota bacterium]
MVVGITGNYCSGKNLASKMFEVCGYTVVDVDKIGHQALEAKKHRLMEVFGKGIVTHGAVDRKKLGRMVFDNIEKKKTLERVVHPWMIKRVKQAVQDAPNAVINAALLVEMCLFVLCDFVLGIQVDEEEAAARGMQRNGLTREQALRIIRSQVPVKEKLHYVDKVIDNNGSMEEFKQKIMRIIKNLHTGV